MGIRVVVGSEEERNVGGRGEGHTMLWLRGLAVRVRMGGGYRVTGVSGV